jgi:hypothetical protein
MARVKVHALCLRPLSECDCPDDDDLDPGTPGDSGDEDDAA